MEADQLGRLKDIAEATRLISMYIDGVDASSFFANREKQDAVVRRIEVIGEVAAHLSEQTREALPELDFRRIRGMRNIVAHDYANIDFRIVWEVATEHIPALLRALEGCLPQLEREG
jgi:uncharacterized protein with HEPN domain